MVNIKFELIDACSKYIEDKDCSYLAKEGQIVYYASTTGRKSDYIWHKLSILEVLRIIRAMRLSTEHARELKERHLITAFQELGRVYEFGVKTRHVTSTGIFNYSEHSEQSLGDDAMGMLVESMQMQGLTAVLMGSVVNLFNVLQAKLKLNLTSTEQRDLMYKHFESVGYILKTGARRPLINNKKQPAIMMPSTKPAEVVGITAEVGNKFIAKIFGELV